MFISIDRAQLHKPLDIYKVIFPLLITILVLGVVASFVVGILGICQTVSLAPVTAYALTFIPPVALFLLLVSAAK